MGLALGPLVFMIKFKKGICNDVLGNFLVYEIFKKDFYLYDREPERISRGRGRERRISRLPAVRGLIPGPP